MRLSETVNNFMEHNTPKWFWNFQNDKGYNDDNIGDPRNCVMGELHGWNMNYGMSGKEFCSTCSALGTYITNNAMRYKVIKRNDELMGLPEYENGEMDCIMRKVIDHVKEKHPELLKQERPIEA